MSLHLRSNHPLYMVLLYMHNLLDYSFYYFFYFFFLCIYLLFDDIHVPAFFVGGNRKGGRGEGEGGEKTFGS